MSSGWRHMFTHLFFHPVSVHEPWCLFKKNNIPTVSQGSYIVDRFDRRTGLEMRESWRVGFTWQSLIQDECTFLRWSVFSLDLCIHRGHTSERLAGIVSTRSLHVPPWLTVSGICSFWADNTRRCCCFPQGECPNPHHGFACVPLVGLMGFFTKVLSNQFPVTCR